MKFFDLSLALIVVACQKQPGVAATSCPEERPEPFDKCTFVGSCEYGEQTCCGETHPNYIAHCFDGEVGLIVNDACLAEYCPDGCPSFKPRAGDTCNWEDQECKYDPVDCCGETVYESVATCGGGEVIFLAFFAPVCLYEPDECPPKGGGSGGDPHFQTWAGDWYDFHHRCDLVLLEVPEFGKGLGLSINIRTTGRYEYSYIETAAIKLGDDVLEVSSFGSYSLNGVSNAPIPALLADQFQLTHRQENKKKHTYEIQLEGEEKILVSTFKDLVSVKVEGATAGSFGTSVGLMGTYGNGTRLARDGVTVLEDPIAFGLEWQVHDDEPNLFQTARFPQYPQVCDPPKQAETLEGRNRRLGEAAISQEAAELACAHWQDDKKNLCI